MSGVRYYCRECCKFVAGPLASCRSCGHTHTRDRRALEEPTRTRRTHHRGVNIR